VPEDLAAMRLAKHLAHAGVASRRAAEQLVFAGRVSVDGEVVTDPARDIAGGERVEVDGELVGSGPAVRVVYALTKPAGVVSPASDTHGRPTVVDLVRTPGDRRLYPVGRLDADTSGLILLTDDGELAHRLTHPSFGVPKTYVAHVGGRRIGDGALRRLREGVELEDGLTAPAQVRRLGPHELELTLQEGRKRQVRRMCEAVGLPVRSLRRVSFGPLALGRLPEGRARRLVPAEVEQLRQAATEYEPRNA
jgi:23S rRNA pseudouridine2605 synthase